MNLDSWTPEQMESIQQWGNKRAAEFWECYLPSDFRRPQTDSAMETFIRNKYERKQYLKKDGLPPNKPTSTKESKSTDKPKKKREKKEDVTITSVTNEADKKTSLSTVQQRPHSHPPPVKAPEPAKPAKPAALVDLLSLDTPAPAAVPVTVPATSSGGLLNSLAQPPASQPAKTGLANQLIDFGAFQQNTIIDTGFSEPQQQQPNNQVPQESNEESLLKDDSLTNKSTKDSIMALYAPKPQGSQPQMYGVPGGMYIAPQQQQQPQQARPNQQPAVFNRMGGVPPQGMPMGMGAPHQPGFMQQQQQIAQIQQQMQQMRLKQQMPQQVNMHNASPSLFGPAQTPVANGWMPQQPMSFPQQQHPQYVTTGPVPGNMGFGNFPMGAVPGSGQTLSHQLWK